MTIDTTVDLILNECILQGITQPEQQAYILATVEWETAGTMKPVIEAFWKSDEWRKANFRYYPFFGRGFVQLTWERNYKIYSKRLTERFNKTIDLVENPNDALIPEYSAFILVNGFKTGAFTGKKISDFINNKKIDYFNARKCINGLDCAQRIADKVEKYLKIIEKK